MLKTLRPTQAPTLVPIIWRVLKAGLPCTDAILLSVIQVLAENRNCIANEPLSTGSVFGRIRRLAMQHLRRCDADLKRGVFSFLAWENVVNRAVRTRGAVRSNLEEVACIFESVG